MKLKIYNTRATAFTVPTDAPEADGTFAWNSTMLILAELSATDMHGAGQTYSHAVTAALARKRRASLFPGIPDLQRNWIWSELVCRFVMQNTFTIMPAPNGCSSMALCSGLWCYVTDFTRQGLGFDFKHKDAEPSVSLRVP